jgi:hypothetical protein
MKNHFDRKINYQKYSHYLLPIANEPLKYGKLIEQFGNKYIIQMNTGNVLLIEQIDKNNVIKFFRRGDLMRRDTQHYDKHAYNCNLFSSKPKLHLKSDFFSGFQNDYTKIFYL